MSQCVVRFAHQYRTVGVPERGIARRVDERGDAPGPLSAGHHELDTSHLAAGALQNRYDSPEKDHDWGIVRLMADSYLLVALDPYRLARLGS